MLLGISRLRLDQPTQAIQPLRKHIDAQPNSLESFRIRNLLQRAFTESGQYRKALLLSEEIRRRKPLPRDVTLENMVLRAKAQIGLDQDLRAKKTIDAFFTSFRKNKNSQQNFESEAILVELELNSREC